MSYKPNPAGNAVRHGLAGTRHVPKEALEQLQQIEADLIAIKNPETNEDYETVRDMSVAMWQVGEHHRQYVEHLAMQQARAEEIFATKAKESFRTLLTDWQADPSGNIDAMSHSYLGAKHLAEIWKAVAESLGPDGVGISLEMTCAAVMAEGVSPSPDKIYGDGAWIMKRYLASTSSPVESVAEWVDHFGLRKSKNVVDRAEKVYLSAPDAGTSAHELHKRAQEKYQYWDNLMQKRRKDYDLAKVQFAQANAGNGMGDKEMENQVRLMHRYRTAAQNRVDRFDRKLKNVQNERVRRNIKKYTQEQKEKKQKQDFDLQVSRLNDAQYNRYNEQINNREVHELYASMKADNERRERAEYYAAQADDDEPQMHIQSVPSAGYAHVREAVEEDLDAPDEVQIAIAPEPEVVDPSEDEELQALVEELFAGEPHELMFRAWPEKFLTQDWARRVMERVRDEADTEDEVKAIAIHLMKEYGVRLYGELTQKQVADQYAANKRQNDQARKARKLARKARKANRG